MNPYKTNIPVLRISSILGTNSYYIAAEHPTLIDTGHPTSTYLLQTLSSNNIDLNEIKYIISSHSHPDHTGAAAILKQKGAKHLGYRPESSRKITQEHHAKLNLTVESVEIDQFLTSGDKISLGNTTLEVIYTPGHSDDHICLFWPQRSALFTGDLITFKDIGFLNLNKHYSRALEELCSSVEKCRSVSPEYLLPGHGPVVACTNQMWNNINRKLLLFKNNPSLLLSHTIISPLLFYLTTKESFTQHELEEYVVSHIDIFNAFVENVTPEIIRSETKKIIAILQLKDLIVEKNGLSLSGSINKFESQWI